ncbi:MAG: dienelactone hydrolase family protein [Burkholderiales bacterium]|nr:dienelactone hydrolase family protein [Burkholderiales bacterium]
MMTSWVSVAAGNGQQYDAYLALPPAGKGPGIVLFQEIFGVNAHIQGVAEQYAQDGFVVLAPDLFWRQQRRVELGYEGDDRARALEMMKACKPEELQADVKSSVAALRARPELAGKVGAIGYCMGGRLAYFAAAITDVDAAVAYYGGGIHDNLQFAPQLQCPIQFHYAAEDQAIPLAAVDKVKAAVAGKPAEFFIYEGATHGFNCWDRASYNPKAASLAHGRSLAFFSQLF